MLNAARNWPATTPYNIRHDAEIIIERTKICTRSSSSSSAVRAAKNIADQSTIHSIA
jgi:hypothetical protein